MRAELRTYAERTATLVSSRDGTGVIHPRGDRPSFPTAATEMALDSGAVRLASAQSQNHPRTQSKVTPLGTELDDFEIPRRRWTGLVLAALLLGATLTILVVKLTQKKNVAIDPVTTMPSVTLPNDADASLADAGDTLAPLVTNVHPKRPKTTKSDAGVADTSAAAGSSSAGQILPVVGNYEPSGAHVILGGITPRNTGNREVRAAIDLETYSQCFRDGLKGVTVRPARSHVKMIINTDESGKVNDFTIGGPMPESTPACIKKAVVGKTIGGAGAVGADVDLLFLPGIGEK
jgi:hypothetical protein